MLAVLPNSVVDENNPPTPSPGPTATPGPGARNGSGVSRGKPTAAPPNDDPTMLRLVCPRCQQGLRIPRSAVSGAEPVNVRCPNPECRVVLTVTPKAPVEDPATKTEA